MRGWLSTAAIAMGLVAASLSVAAERELRLAPVADGYVKASRSTRVFGKRRRLVVAGRPEAAAYIRFAVPPLDGERIVEARLQLSVTTARRARKATGGTIYLAGTAPWTEAELTFKNRPSLAPAPVADIGRVNRKELVEIPVTGALLPGTEATFAVVGGPQDRARYVAREGGGGTPALVLRLRPDDGAEPPACESCGDPASGPDGGTVCEPGCGPAPQCTLDYYGSWSLRTKYADTQEERVQQLAALGGNFVASIGESLDRIEALTPEIGAVVGCGLLHEEDWRDATGAWSASKARSRLAELAEEFDNHPQVWGACISHEVTEYANHERRRWMYELAKEFFVNKKVIHYYSRPPDDYGYGGVESDVFFISLPPYTELGEYDLDRVLRRLDAALLVLDRTPGIPLWAVTSINADQGYVSGPETMVRTWGMDGENMLLHTEAIFSRTGPGGQHLTGFFWRSLGRFDWDLAYPPFVRHRERMAEIADRWLCR